MCLGGGDDGGRANPWVLSKTLFLGLVFTCVLNVPAAVAQETIAIPCDAFKKNADGSWNPTRELTFTSPKGPMTMRPGVSFRPGVPFSGVDMATVLDQLCGPPK